MKNDPARLNPEMILQITADAFTLPLGQLTYGRRTTYRTRARWTAAHLLRRTGSFSWSDIARLLHYADHTSARAGALALRELMTYTPYLRDLVRSLEVRLHLPAEIIDQKGSGEPSS